jgi:hypothetical protein
VQVSSADHLQLPAVALLLALVCAAAFSPEQTALGDSEVRTATIYEATTTDVTLCLMILEPF